MHRCELQPVRGDVTLERTALITGAVLSIKGESMPRLILYRAYETRSFSVYTLEPVRGHLTDTAQVFTLSGGKLYFQWPHDLRPTFRDLKETSPAALEILGFTGVVPETVVRKGNAAVLEYVAALIAQHRNDKERACVERLMKIHATNVAIVVRHDGQMLKGRIVWQESRRSAVQMVLESPYESKNTIEMCFGLAMAGKQLFTQEGDVSTWVYEHTKQFFISSYEREKQKEKLPSHYEIRDL
jgi:hypothetical protein